MATRVPWMILMGILSGCAYGPPGHGGLPPGHGGIPPGQAKKMGPPPLVLLGAPRYAVVPGSSVTVLLGVEADVFRVDGHHYYHHQGTWYSAQSYFGPWRAISPKHLPRGLYGKSPKNLKAKLNGHKGYKRKGRWK